ncbi:MAG: isoprenylcysteine carboxylmethyltransferase family protein [Gammaproteobacteria bacterium]|nr:MAG: isoprenylcysteine carboxylmethyltransferase family protein [Gammaproteobacteria bacterium]
MNMLRHIRAILTLPFTVLCVAPALLLLLFYDMDTRWDIAAPAYGVIFLAAIVLLLTGTALVVITVYLFCAVGEGTLAPWDPTKKLVVEGPYRYVRNPMITGVLTVLSGESIVTGSFLIAAFAAFLFGLNHVYFILSEEPGLVKRFGEPYKKYMSNVPRWIPRPTPWAAKDNQPDQ